jgi:hypothetical protein
MCDNRPDYQIGDAPILIVNSLAQQQISVAQKDDLYSYGRIFILK